MKRQTITWTALPNGVVGGDLRLSVFISPRLETDEVNPFPHPPSPPELVQFPDFTLSPVFPLSKYWPDNPVSFIVLFAAGGPFPATLVDPTPPGPPVRATGRRCSRIPPSSARTRSSGIPSSFPPGLTCASAPIRPSR